jgi:ADP-heptose:LPS heptosyltransferase
MSRSLPDPGLEPLPRKGIYRILVCRPNHRLGNTILLTPLLAELERTYPGAEIDVISEGNIAKEVFATFFSVRNIHCLPRRGFKHPVSFLSLLRHVRKTRYDLIVDPCVGSGFSRVLTRFLKGRYKLGFDDDPAHSGLTHCAPASVAPRHMAKRPIDLLRCKAGREHDPSEFFPPMDIRLTDAERAQGKDIVRDLLAGSTRPVRHPVVGIFANATGAKRYPAAWWNEFITTFRERAPSSSIIELIPMNGQSLLGSEWPAYYSSDIRRMGAVMAGTDLMISADCGVMHLAVASKVPTAGMFCATDAAVYAPYSHGSCALVTQGLSAREAAERVAAAFEERLSVDHRRVPETGRTRPLSGALAVTE